MADFIKTPGTLALVPVLYAVWNDLILTPEEARVLELAVDQQNWLSTDEKICLRHYLRTSAEINPQILNDWLQTVRSLKFKNRENLITTGIRLARTLNSNFDIPAESKAVLGKIDTQLGIPDGETPFIFFPEQRNTLTAQTGTRIKFDVSEMKSILSGDDTQIISRIHEIISKPEFSYIDTGDLNEYREQILKWAKILAEHGIGSLAYPEEFGGSNDLKAYFAAMEALSCHDLSLVVKFGVQFGLWGMSVFLLGTEKHHKKYLQKIGTLELPGCFAMTETGHGSNVKGIETTATYNHSTKTFSIHTPVESAQKEYIGNAALHGRMATVFAKIIIDGKDYGVGAFIVPLRNENGELMPGVFIKDCGRKLGLNGVDNGVIRFNQVTIPADEMLDRFASVNSEGKFESPIASDNRRFFTMLGALVGGRIGIPRSGIAASRSGLTIAIRYGDGRKQFGPEGGTEVPILNYRSHQRRLIPKLANTYALHFALQYLTDRYVNRKEDEMQEIEALAAGLKSIATRHTTETLQECREACGGKGYLWENRIGTLKNDTDIYTTFEGDNTVLLQLVAKSRLSDFKQEFSSMGALGILNVIAGQAITAITEMNPVAIRRTDEEHLLDPEFHKEAFEYRQRDMLFSVAKRLKRLISGGMDSFDAFNVCQHHLIETSEAYIHGIILQQFRAAIEKTNDSACREMLEQLYRVYVMNHLEENKGWFLEQGYMDGVKTKAIRKMLNQLCWEVRQDAVPLVDSFGIPESCLFAPIARRN